MRENGYDGLVNVEMECGCVIGDIMPCGEIDNVIGCSAECQCGYSNPERAADNGCDHWMQPDKHDDKYSEIRSMSAKDRKEVFEFAMQRSKEILEGSDE